MSASQQQQAAFVPGARPLVCESFKGINTQVSRPAVPEEQLAWCDGFMPIGPGNLRTLYGVGPPIHGTDNPGELVYFEFGNIASTPYAIIVESDGSIVAANTATGLAISIAPAGTIQSPSPRTVALSQWGAQFIIIVAYQTNGYFLWDGATLFTAGGLSPLVVVTAGGTDYSSTPVIAASGGSGTGATFSATVTDGVITAITVTNPGTGYLAGDTVTLGITDTTGSGATATATLMPVGISGTAVETYQSRVWVANGPIINYSSPSDPSDFDPTNGAGTFKSTDSFLRVGYVALIATGGFLYLIGDSSINYISGVNTAGSAPVVTTFSNLNANPEVGTPYSSTVDVFNENIIFVNAWGVHVSYGSRVTKVSEALDGVFNTVPNFGGQTLSASKAIIFGKRVWMTLIPVISPLDGQQYNKLFIWDGKVWWSSQQDVPLTYIQHQEIDSVLTAWGTDGQFLYPLFQQPSAAIGKVFRSKFWAQPVGYQTTKSANRFWGLAQVYSDIAPIVNISVDSETASTVQTLDLSQLVATWINNTGDLVEWLNDASDVVTWYGFPKGVVVFDPEPAAANGALLGFTLATNATDMAIISTMLEATEQNYRG